MGQVYLRNVQTGEVQDFLLDSPEFRAAVAERVEDSPGHVIPLYEQQGDHYVRRVDSGEVRESDLGNEHRVPAVVGDQTVGPDPHPGRSLTEAEVEAGIKSHDQKADELGFARSEDDQAKLDEGLANAGTTDATGAVEPVAPGSGSGQAPEPQPESSNSDS